MSRKLQSLLSVVANPANLHRFRISIPDVNENFTAIVESTTFPAPGPIREISLWIDGEQVRYPGQPENGGTWTFKVPEGDKFQVSQELDKLLTDFVDWKTGLIKPNKWRDILVTSLDLQDKPQKSVKLMGCWMKNRNSINLSAADPSNAWKWDYVFVYNWVDPNPNL